MKYSLLLPTQCAYGQDEVWAEEEVGKEGDEEEEKEGWDDEDEDEEKDEEEIKIETE